ncbi:MAG: DUF1538 domain-containing protein [Clostridiales bacterium]|nr:DUF1538 domain-containing protein [Clostridiales bacterium]
MFKALLKKLQESAVSVIPVALIVLLLNFTPLVRFTTQETAVFCFCAVALIIGMALFNLGADMAMTPMGEQVGAGLPKSGKFKTLLIVCFAMGVFVTIAEPDLSVLATQVKDVINSTMLVCSIGIGVGVFLVLGILRIVFRLNLAHLMTFFYLLLFALASLILENGNGNFLPLSFDSGGVTTGPITVPFIMSLGVGVSAALGDKRDRESSFGFIALCSIGPILAVLFLGLFSTGTVEYSLPDYTMKFGAGEIFTTLLHTGNEVLVALLPIAVFFFILQFLFLKLPKARILQIIVGIFYTLFGLVIFLSAVTVGFMPLGYKMGTQLAEQAPWILVLFAFVLGLTVVLAEPAIHVLNKQVENVTGGAVSKRSMLIALSIGVGTAIALSVIRVIFDFSVLYYLIPGYFLSLGLSFFVPKLYTAIAFDSGGVASGPLTSTFILPFVVGVCAILQGESAVLLDAFGLVAMVAMTPLITIQTLGFKAVTSRRLREQLAMKRILEKDDEQIISFL